MCEVLGENITEGGSSKQAQIKKWKRHFDFRKEGQKFVITKVYSEPLPKDDKRQEGNTSIYFHHIKALLLFYLSENNGILKITYNDLYCLLGMVNKNYHKLSNQEIIEMDELKIIDDFQINHFYQRTGNKLRDIMYKNLNILKNRNLIDYNQNGRGFIEIKLINHDFLKPNETEIEFHKRSLNEKIIDTMNKQIEKTIKENRVPRISKKTFSYSKKYPVTKKDEKLKFNLLKNGAAKRNIDFKLNIDEFIDWFINTDNICFNLCACLSLFILQFPCSPFADGLSGIQNRARRHAPYASTTEVYSPRHNRCRQG
jgi:hypothetical protein